MPEWTSARPLRRTYGTGVQAHTGDIVSYDGAYYCVLRSNSDASLSIYPLPPVGTSVVYTNGDTMPTTLPSHIPPCRHIRIKFLSLHASMENTRKRTWLDYLHSLDTTLNAISTGIPEEDEALDVAKVEEHMGATDESEGSEDTSSAGMSAAREADIELLANMIARLRLTENDVLLATALSKEKMKKSTE